MNELDIDGQGKDKEKMGCPVNSEGQDFILNRGNQDHVRINQCTCKTDACK